MSLKVIELNDAALKVADESGIVLQSPGFALSRDKTLLLGDAAEQQARLHPTLSYNKYWHELSLDPLRHSSSIRHYADIAYAQLLHLAEQACIEGEVLFAVPGNFTRQQLAILLGLAKQCPFQTVGVVDSALAAGIAAAGTEPLVYAELQLHQVLITRLKVVDNKLTLDAVVQVPGVGSQNVTDQMMQIATNAFIQQCRFNPQHNAETEQQLYNSLPHWWRGSSQDDSGLVLELRVGSTVHTAKLPRETLINSLGSHYQKLKQQLASLATENDAKILLNAGLAALPGLQTLLGTERDLQVIDATAISASCLQLHDHIRSTEQGIRLVTTLPVIAAPQRVKNSTGADTASEVPTHVLYNSRAFPVAKVQVTNNQALNGHAPAHTIQLALAGLPAELGRMRVDGNAVFLDSGAVEFLLNDRRVSGKQQLRLGDRINFTADSAALTLIRVS